MIVSIAQPAYLPWPGYFARIAKSDVHVVLDHVQFSDKHKDNFVNRNKIRKGESWQWLTVPVTHSLSTRICDVALDGSPWQARHAQAIEDAYARAPFWHSYGPFTESQSTDLLGTCLSTLWSLSTALGIHRRCHLSSCMHLTETKSALVLQICERLGASTYLSGPQGRNYLDLPAFECAGIQVVFDNYTPPVYSQFQGGFVPGLSVIDLLFNCGPKAREIVCG